MDREILLRIVIFVLAIIIATLVSYLAYVETKYEKFRLNLHIQEKDAQEAREKLLLKVKDKIELTQRSRTRNNDDLIAQYIYRQDCVQDLGAEMKDVYAKEYCTLQAQYPSLTELDLLVLSLLANGMDNYDICTLLKMEKRTLYRRRQLIAQRIGISSTVLDDFASSFFMPE